jgi:hypothetical protein
MKVQTIALVLAGALAAAGGAVGIVACSSDSGTGGGNPPDGAVGSPDTNQPAVDANQPGVDSNLPPVDGGTSDGPATCTHGAAPTLHPDDGGPGSLWCGFLSNDAGKLYCNPSTQVCCNGGKMGTGFADPTCNAQGTACTNGTGPEEFDCEDQLDCQDPAAVCCFGGNTIAHPDPVCLYDYAHASGSYTRCVHADAGGACSATEETVCTSDAECANIAGKPHCTPFKVIYYGLGHCTP